MPRTGKGGARTGTPGVAHAQRTDLNAPAQPVRVAPSQTYGEGVKQEAAQQAMPLPNSAAVPPAQGAPVPGSSPMPGQAGAFDRPTDRPLEHVATGLPIGGGAGPEALSPYVGDDTSAQLRALYAKFPNPDLADLIQVAELNRR